MGDGLHACAARARAPRRSRLSHRRAGRCDRDDRTQPALPDEGRPARGRGRPSRRRARRRGRRRRRGAEPGVRGRRRTAAGHGARAQPDEGARPCDGGEAVDTGDRKARRRALRPEHRRRDRRRAAHRGGDRERGRLPRGAASACRQLDGLPHLRESRRHGRRAQCSPQAASTVSISATTRRRR